jgi:hypothetical protein
MDIESAPAPAPVPTEAEIMRAFAVFMGYRRFTKARAWAFYEAASNEDIWNLLKLEFRY